MAFHAQTARYSRLLIACPFQGKVSGAIDGPFERHFCAAHTAVHARCGYVMAGGVDGDADPFWPSPLLPRLCMGWMGEA